MNLLNSWGWEILPHPPYSPDLAPSDFDLFSKMKKHLTGEPFHFN
jgi:histone-lysine N-methyltransferase SETMAR